MSLKEYIGLTGPEYELDIERGKIREFSNAMYAPIPDFIEGYTPVIPATFLSSAPYTWGYSLERPRGTVFESIDHDFSVPLHAEESIIFHGEPPRAGDRLTCQLSLENVKTKTGSKGGDLTFLTTLNEYKNMENQVVVEQRSTTVTTEQSPKEEGWHVTVPDYKPSYPTIDPEALFTNVYQMSWEDLVEGNGPGIVDAGPLMIREMVRFQGAVGEDNPLHYDKAWATSFGFPALFGLGMHQASVLASYAAHWLDPKAVRSFRARFMNVYWVGDCLHYNVKVARKYIENEHRKVDLVLYCTRPPGDPIVDAWMTLDFGTH